MKVYPIIYGRTKYVDYLPDFLVRPYDLEIKDAFSCVSLALEGIEPFNEVRYCVFSTNTYVVVGMACYLNDLAEVCGIKQAEHVRDAMGRLIAGFVGVALKRDEDMCTAPYISEQYCWQLYQNYIDKQWNYPCDVRALLLYENDMEEISSVADINTPQVIEKYKNKIIVENTGADSIGFFVREVCLGKIKGYISSVNSMDLLTKVQFEYVSVTTNVLRAIKKSKERIVVSNTHITNANTATDTAFSRMRKSSNIMPINGCTDAHQEKENSFWNPLWVIGAIIGGIIIVLLIVI